MYFIILKSIVTVSGVDMQPEGHLKKAIKDKELDGTKDMAGEEISSMSG